MHRGAGAGAGVRGSVKTDMHEPKGASLLFTYIAPFDNLLELLVLALVS